ncbi:hypothetical protein BDV97DRAFT_372743 [Delphinella strobiligena]|nr:hypothetical protein BDV97DRAFT_372743 [Delphinella strobiligena]
MSYSRILSTTPCSSRCLPPPPLLPEMVKPSSSIVPLAIKAKKKQRCCVTAVWFRTLSTHSSTLPPGRSRLSIETTNTRGNHSQLLDGLASMPSLTIMSRTGLKGTGICCSTQAKIFSPRAVLRIVLHSRRLERDGQGTTEQGSRDFVRVFTSPGMRKQ